MEWSTSGILRHEQPSGKIRPRSDQIASRVEIRTCVWVRTLSFFPLRVRSQGFNEAKFQLGGWIYCCSIVQHKYYLSLLLQQGRFESRATNTWQEIFPRGQFTFPWQVTMWRRLVWGEPLTSLPLIRKPASGTRASNGGGKISTKTVRKKQLLVVVISWNLAWWLRTTNYVRKCKNMECQNSRPSGTLKGKSYYFALLPWLRRQYIAKSGVEIFLKALIH